MRKQVRWLGDPKRKIKDDPVFVRYVAVNSDLLCYRIIEGHIHDIATLKKIFHIKNIELRIFNTTHPVYAYLLRVRMIEAAICGIPDRGRYNQAIANWLLNKLKVQHAYLKKHLPESIGEDLDFYRCIVKSRKRPTSKHPRAR